MRRKREPTSPDEILLEEFMKPLGLAQRRLARSMDCLWVLGPHAGNSQVRGYG